MQNGGWTRGRERRWVAGFSLDQSKWSGLPVGMPEGAFEGPPPYSPKCKNEPKKSARPVAQAI